MKGTLPDALLKLITCMVDRVGRVSGNEIIFFLPYRHSQGSCGLKNLC